MSFNLNFDTDSAAVKYVTNGAHTKNIVISFILFKIIFYKQILSNSKSCKMNTGQNTESHSFDIASILPTIMMMNRGTDFPWFQMFFAIIVPFLLRIFQPTLLDKVKTGFQFNGRYAKRQIKFVKAPRCWWEKQDDDDQAVNEVIQKSILNFVNKELVLVTKGWVHSDINARRESREVDGMTSYSHLSYICTPPQNVWVDLKNGIELSLYEFDNRPNVNKDDKRPAVMTTTMTLRTMSKNLSELDAFIDTCIKAYNSDLLGKVDGSRYMYTPIAHSPDKTSSDKTPTTTGMLFKAYKLSEVRTFDSFFHPEKASVLALIDQFVNKTGKFAVPGYPQKLGFLLYGPPGTGKTSFIKALAKYTNRHIVNVPLNRIKTNHDLYSIMFDQKVLLVGSATEKKLSHDKVVFVMEDIDAETSIVQKRSSVIPAKVEEEDSMMMEVATAALAALSSQNEDEKDVSLFKKDNSDNLSLAALLNVLDGVVDTPGRIVVMTTNHPEKLDPALIRPGRINRKLLLGNVKKAEARDMILHYFSELSDAQDALLYEVFTDDAFTPSQIETLCSEYEDVDSLLRGVSLLLLRSSSGDTLPPHPHLPQPAAQKSVWFGKTI